MPICQKIGATGSGIVVRELVERTARRGFRLQVICASNVSERDESCFAEAAVKVTSVPFDSPEKTALQFPIAGMSDRMPYRSVRFRDLTFVEVESYLAVWQNTLRDAIADFQPDLVHVHHLWLLAAVCAAVTKDVPVVVSIHGTDLQQARSCPHLRALVAPWIGRFDRFLALSESAIDDTLALYSASCDRFVVMGNGFSSELFHPRRRADPTLADRYGLGPWPANRRAALFVGKYVEWKGIEWLIRAFARVLDRDQSDLLLIIAGTGPDEERARYLQIARESGVAEQVLLTGQVRYEDVGELMNLAEVFVLPSFHEPFGLVLLEALACGCRIVCTDQGGPAEFVPVNLRVDRDAILVPGLSDDSAEEDEAERFIDHLAEALTEQLSKPLSLANRQRISRAVEHLSWDVYVEEIVRLYLEAVSRTA